MRTVGQVAAATGVTVRTLHHYDEIGLVRPSGRSDAGYRLYADADVALLARVVRWRRLGLSLEQVAAAVRGDVVGQLQQARAAVAARRAELDQLGRDLDRAVEEEVEGVPQHEGPGAVFEDPWEQEAQDRWGSTPAWEQSRRRTSGYTARDWAAVRAEADAITGRLAAALAADLPADGTEAMDAAQAHRDHLARWFYDCPPAMHACLGEMFAADERFAAHYERVAPGLAGYVRDAVVANAARW